MINIEIRVPGLEFGFWLYYRGLSNSHYQYEVHLRYPIP